VDIVEFKPAVVEENFKSSKGEFMVRVVAEPVMVSRNMNYRSIHNEPIYSVSWVAKISWRPVTR